MNKQLDEEKFDDLMRSLLKSTAVDDETIEEIAGSPAIWWGVKRQIAEQTSLKTAPWPPANRIFKWLAFTVPAVAAAVLVMTFVVFRPAGTPEQVAGVVSPKVDIVTPQISEPVADTTAVSSDQQPEPVAVSDASPKQPRPVVVRAKVRPTAKRLVGDSDSQTEAATTTTSEIKTNFIALSYARDPESGQIVRVKVPSSMMVSLGLVASVKKPTDLIDAEVLVGDDGLTRAIRFIR